MNRELLWASGMLTFALSLGFAPVTQAECSASVEIDSDPTIGHFYVVSCESGPFTGGAMYIVESSPSPIMVDMSVAGNPGTTMFATARGYDLTGREICRVSMSSQNGIQFADCARWLTRISIEVFSLPSG
jgi:hypothetical protein